MKTNWWSLKTINEQAFNFISRWQINFIDRLRKLDIAVSMLNRC